MCTSNVAGMTDKLVLSKMESRDDTVITLYSLTIRESFSWFVTLSGHVLPTSALAEFDDKLSTVCGVHEVLSYLDSCTLCVGNPDEKYVCLSEARKGVFMDSSGKN